MSGTSDIVHYNYPLMDGIATQLQQCGTVAQHLLEAGRATKNTMLGTFHGTSANTFLDCFTKFEHVNQDTIDITMRGVQAYHTGTQGMMTNEAQMSSWFPH
jgi:uncharacterized protein YukE